jgi:hypothetical protein
VTYRILSLAALIFCLPATSLEAQRYSSTFTPWEPQVHSLPGAPVAQQQDSVSQSLGDYRYEGLAFGGLVFGALGAWLGSRNYGSCSLEPGGGCSGNRDRLGNGIAVGLVGAAVGGGLGYLVGRFSPKRPRPDSTLMPSLLELAGVPDSVRRRVGYQHWRGAGIGGAVGAAVGAVAGLVLTGITDSCDDCGEQWSPGKGALVMGLLGAGTGGVAGFLAGLSSPKYEWVPRDP